MIASELLTVIRQRAYMPSVSATGSDDASLLRMINEELRTNLVPMVMRVREEYFLRDYDSTVLDGIFAYRVPKRAMGGIIRRAYRVDGSGTELPLNRVDIDDTWSVGYRLIGPNLVLNEGSVPVGETIRIRVFVRPGTLVTESECGRINNVVQGTGVITMDNVPTAFVTSAMYDAIKSNQFHELVFEDETISARVTGANGTITMNTGFTVPDIGDYVALAGQSPYPMIPEDLHALLAQRVACVWLAQAGGGSDLQKALELLKAMGDDLTGLISSRTNGDKIIVNHQGLVGWWNGRLV